jgi:hypothetical protein
LEIPDLASLAAILLISSASPFLGGIVDPFKKYINLSSYTKTSHASI